MAVKQGVENLLEFFSQSAKRASKIAADDAAQRAAPPEWMDLTRGERAKRALSRSEDPDVPYRVELEGAGEVPLAEAQVAKFRKATGEAEPPLQRYVAGDDDVVELGMEFGPTLKADEVPDEVFDVLNPASRAAYGLREPPEVIKLTTPRKGGDAIASPARAGDADFSVGNKTRTVAGVRAQGYSTTPEGSAVAQAANLSPASTGIGIYSKGGINKMSRIVAREGVGDSVVASVGLEFLGDMAQVIRRADIMASEAPATARWLSEGPIELVVREAGDGIGVVEDIIMPAQMGKFYTPPELDGLRVPVVLRNSSGKPFSAPIRLFRNEDGTQIFNGPEKQGWSDARKFDDPLDPNFYRYQANTPEQVEQVVQTMLSSKGMVLHAKIMDEDFFRRIDDDFHPVDLVSRWLSRAWRSGKKFTRFGGEQWDAETAFQHAEIFYRDRVLVEQKEMYKRFTNMDPVILERLRRFGEDSPFKLRMFGETDPDLKDLPMVWWHLDQKTFVPEQAGINAALPQFGNAAEMGMHSGFTVVQPLELMSGRNPETKIEAYKWWEKGNQKSELSEFYGKIEGRLKSIRESLLKVTRDNGIALTRQELAQSAKISNRGLARSNNEWGTESKDAFQQVDKAAQESHDYLLKRLQEKGLGQLDTFAQVQIKAALEQLRSFKVQAFDQVWNTSMNAFVFNGKKPLVLPDLSNFAPSTVAQVLLEMPQFEKHTSELLRISQGDFDKRHWSMYVAGKPEAEQSPEFAEALANLRGIIESEGFDSIMYFNVHEQFGLPSLISWKEGLHKFTTASLFSREGGGVYYGAAGAAVGVSALTEENEDDGT